MPLIFEGDNSNMIFLHQNVNVCIMSIISKGGLKYV
jgi:hypothetical protein